jgi:hypothetical protein
MEKLFSVLNRSFHPIEESARNSKDQNMLLVAYNRDSEHGKGDCDCDCHFEQTRVDCDCMNPCDCPVDCLSAATKQ